MKKVILFIIVFFGLFSHIVHKTIKLSNITAVYAQDDGDGDDPDPDPDPCD